MTAAKCNIISKTISAQFRKLGALLCRNPSYFIVIPVFVSVLLATGLQNLRQNNETEFLLFPDNTRTYKEMKRIEYLFPMEIDKNFELGRITDFLSGCLIIITAKDGGSVFRTSVFQQTVLLDEMIQNVSITSKGRRWEYRDICVKNNRKCFENTVLLLADKIDDITQRKHFIKYPLQMGKVAYRDKIILYAFFLGGVEVDQDGNVKDAKALRLLYAIDNSTPMKEDIAETWETEFLNKINSASFEDIVVDVIASTSAEKEMVAAFLRIVPLFLISAAAVFVFSVVTCMKGDWIQSKPWTAFIATTSAILSLLSAFGLLSYCGVPFNYGLGFVPFIILGVGMDDTFVLLAAWRHTDPKKKLEERMGEAYAESSIAITITSLTNFIAFVSGVSAPYAIVRIECIYSSVSMLFCYIYQITFVGACMAVCARTECENRHCITFLPVKTPTGKENWFTTTFCGRNGCFFRKSSSFTIDIIWGKVADVLNLLSIKVMTLLVVTAYLVIGMWGITTLKHVLDPRSGAAYDSYLIDYYDKHFKYFSRYSERIQIIIDEELDYANLTVQKQVEDLVSEVESNQYIADSSLTESWLRHYQLFLNDRRVSSTIASGDMTDTALYLQLLRRLFLRFGNAKRYQRDIRFNENYTAVVASRFLCQASLVASIDDLYSRTIKLRKSTSRAPFRAFPYSIFHFVIDETEIRVKLTIQLIISVAAIVFGVFFLFVPDAIVVLSAMVSVVLIGVSVIGYMALWNVIYGPVSMMILVMSLGFSVDYAAHMSYAYITSTNDDPSERMRAAIKAVGMPIFQGSVSSILSVLPLAYPVAYMYVATFKIVFLVIAVSTLYTLMFLPMMLSFLDTMFKRSCRKSMKEDTRNVEMTLYGKTNEGFNSAA